MIYSDILFGTFSHDMAIIPVVFSNMSIFCFVVDWQALFLLYCKKSKSWDR